jgi:protoporphyrin/coproporphyrin ferrochelatase
MGMTAAEKNVAVVLLQLGGPDSLEAVEPFLYNLFCDPDIIDFPGAFLARKALARFISRRRSVVVRENYRAIGGKSPIVDLTMGQAAALDQALKGVVQAKVFVAMRYWHPLTEEVIAEIMKGSFDRIILLPLYPQYSLATTVSSVKEWKNQSQRLGLGDISTETICCYHNHPLYIESIVERVNQTLTKFPGLDPRDIDLVFSAHGVPMKLVKAGDPYKGHIEETVKLVMEKGGWSSPHRLCYQSKVGPLEWLRPSLNETIDAMAAEGRKHLLVIPVAFVTDHIETLHEINIETRERAKHLGITHFELMPGLNSSPLFIACLKDLVVRNI